MVLNKPQINRLVKSYITKKGIVPRNLYDILIEMIVAMITKDLDQTIVPDTDDTYDIGSDIRRLAALYVNKLDLPFIEGSITFTNIDGVLSEDNSNLFWDDTNNRIGIRTNTPTAALDVNGTTEGVLIPRLTLAQRDAIVSPDESELIYNAEDGQFEYYDGANWKSLAGTFKGRMTLASPIYPPIITTSQDNYNPVGLAKTNAIYLSASTNTTITGMAAPSPAEAQILWLFNYGTKIITFKDSNNSSLPENRFLFGADKTVQPNESLSIIYDPNSAGLTQLGWRAGAIVI